MADLGLSGKMVFDHTLLKFAKFMVKCRAVSCEMGRNMSELNRSGLRSQTLASLNLATANHWLFKTLVLFLADHTFRRGKR